MIPSRLLPFGNGGLLAELDDLDAVLSLVGALADAHPPGIVDVVPAARTVLVQFDGRISRAAVAKWIRAAAPRQRNRGSAPAPVVVPVHYDGPDLAAVADRTGLTPGEVIDLHCGADLTVAFCGFAPGFAYLTGLPAELRVPRRDLPRTRVPTGSVALADEFTGVYPRHSPGGWQLIGRTDLVVFDLDRSPPALLTPGAAVRFVPAR